MVHRRSYPMLPGKQIAAGERPTPSLRKRGDLTFLVGNVESVDVDKQSMTLRLFDSVGTMVNVKFCQPYAGTSSYIMAVPEVGSLVVVGSQDGSSYPLCYIPHYALGIESKNIKKWPDTVKTNYKNSFFYRTKKLNPGEIGLGSSEGIEIFLSNHLKIDDRIGNSFLLKSDDNSFIHTACNNFVFSSGVWQSSGIIKRNSIDISDEDDIPNVFREELSNGQYTHVLKPGGLSQSADPYYTEYLIEVEDQGFGEQPENDVNGNSNRTIRKPIAIFSMGNFVGNNQSTDLYGKLLKISLFNNPDDDIGDFLFEPVSNQDADIHGLAIALFKPERTNPERGGFFGIDKEGHVYQYIPSTTGGGLGKGRSMSLLARGSKKEIWGQDSRYGNAWDLIAKGGIKWVVGRHNERDGNPYSNRSIDIRTEGSTFYQYGTEFDTEIKDFENEDVTLSSTRDYYKIERVGGKERKEIENTREIIVRSNDKLRVEGAKTEEIIGAKTNKVGSNLNISVGDMFSENVSKEKQESYGSHRTTIVKGGKETTIRSLVGNIDEEIKVAGNKRTKIKIGNIEERITSGNRTFRTNSGNYVVETVAGNINMRTRAGQISLQTKVGKAEFRSSLGIDIKTSLASNVNISGGTIKLKGKTSVLSKVITDRTHLDYITGAPLRGSISVKATV